MSQSSSCWNALKLYRKLLWFWGKLGMTVPWNQWHHGHTCPSCSVKTVFQFRVNAVICSVALCLTIYSLWVAFQDHKCCQLYTPLKLCKWHMLTTLLFIGKQWFSVFSKSNCCYRQHHQVRNFTWNLQKAICLRQLYTGKNDKHIGGLGVTCTYMQTSMHTEFRRQYNCSEFTKLIYHDESPVTIGCCGKKCKKVQLNTNDNNSQQHLHYGR